MTDEEIVAIAERILGKPIAPDIENPKDIEFARAIEAAARADQTERVLDVVEHYAGRHVRLCVRDALNDIGGKAYDEGWRALTGDGKP